LKRIKIRAGRGATLRAGIAALFVALLPIVRSKSPTALSRDSCDCGVVAAPSIPQRKHCEVERRKKPAQ
jgi:hypothetical protein